MTSSGVPPAFRTSAGRSSGVSWVERGRVPPFGRFGLPVLGDRVAERTAPTVEDDPPVAGLFGFGDFDEVVAAAESAYLVDGLVEVDAGLLTECLEVVEIVAVELELGVETRLQAFDLRRGLLPREVVADVVGLVVVCVPAHRDGVSNSVVDRLVREIGLRVEFDREHAAVMDEHAGRKREIVILGDVEAVDILCLVEFFDGDDLVILHRTLCVLVVDVVFRFVWVLFDLMPVFGSWIVENVATKFADTLAGVELLKILFATLTVALDGPSKGFGVLLHPFRDVLRTLCSPLFIHRAAFCE